MGDNFGGSIERAEAIIKYHEDTRQKNPFFNIHRMKTDDYSDDGVMINLSSLKCLVAMSKRWMDVSDTMLKSHKDGYG